MPNSGNKDDHAAQRSAAASRSRQKPDGPDGSAAPVRPPLPRSRILLFGLIVVCGTAVDLATKHWVFDRLSPPPPRDHKVICLFPHYVAAGRPPLDKNGQEEKLPSGLILELSLNRGALFGFGQGWVLLFVLLSVLAAGGIVYWLFVIGEARDLWLLIALSLMTAGICGNLYDRLGLHGLTDPPAENGGEPQRIYAVRDWILVKYGDFKWPNFNVADSLLVCGAGMLLAELFLARGPKSPPTASTAGEPHG